MLRKTICMYCREAAELFYHPEPFTRGGAMPMLAKLAEVRHHDMTTPLRTATPNSAMNPTPAEMLNGMPRGGNAYDNALAETVIGLFKTEVIRRRGPWRSLDAVEFATLEWVDWFNHRRLLEPIGYVPPAEYESATIGSPQWPE
jgi:putative transposase